MLDIAEKCFARMAQEIKDRGFTVDKAFEKHIQAQDVEGEQVLLMNPVGFLEGIKDLGIDDLEEIEIACLMRVLAKPNMDSAILLSELIVIMENFGIGEDDEGDMEGDMEGQSEIVGGDNIEGSPTDEPKKKKGKGVDLSQLDEKSVKIMAKLMLAMMELNMSLYEFFEGCIYEQLVKSKKKEDTIEIIKAENFFDRLQERGVRKKNAAHPNL